VGEDVSTLSEPAEIVYTDPPHWRVGEAAIRKGDAPTRVYMPRATGTQTPREGMKEVMHFFMLISPCIVNQFLKCSNKMTLFCTVFYPPQTAVHVSGETFTHHQELE
jgi:hypothetical protein